MLGALQDIARSAPADFSCRMGGGRAEGRAAAGARSKVNALGHLFGAKEELLDLLEPVLRVAKPTKKVIAMFALGAAVARRSAAAYGLPAPADELPARHRHLVVESAPRPHRVR